MRAIWEMSDLDIARALFSIVDHRSDSDLLYWPGVEDARHGYVPGLRLLPQHANQSDAEFALEAMSGKNRKLRLPEGFLPDKWDGVAPVWRALDVRYDQCIGNCECLPGRDMREAYITIHFRCVRACGRRACGQVTPPAVRSHPSALRCELRSSLFEV